MKHRIRIASMMAVAILFGSAPAFAQIDLTGEWGARQQEDQPHRNPGPELGDYAGFPINQAARQKAEAWDASILSQPERQTQPHPAQYSLRGGGGPNLHFAKIYNPLDHTLMALRCRASSGARTASSGWTDARTLGLHRAHLGRLLHRRLGRRHARRHHHAHEAGRHSAQRHRPSKSLRRDDGAHLEARGLPDDLHVGRRSDLPGRAVRADQQLGQESERQSWPRRRHSK